MSSVNRCTPNSILKLSIQFLFFALGILHLIGKSRNRGIHAAETGGSKFARAPAQFARDNRGGSFRVHFPIRQLPTTPLYLKHRDAPTARLPLTVLPRCPMLLTAGTHPVPRSQQIPPSVALPDCRDCDWGFLRR
jgi:hypothetical protein